MEPSFSLIMPTYNRKNTIPLAINTVIATGFSNWELIIVDDESTDSTGEFIKNTYGNYLADGHIKYIYVKGRHGVGHCRNVGLQESSNEWIGYLDSDNLLERDYFSVFSEAIEKNTEIRLFYAQYITFSGKIGKSHSYSRDDLEQGNYIDMGVFVHHRSMYESLGGFDEKLKRLVDWDLLLTYTAEKSALFIDSVVMRYNDDDRSDRITKKESMSLACSQIAKKHGLHLVEVNTIIPTFNHEKFLEKAIDSAIAQDGYFIHKILISDDCSTDSTRQIITRYCELYPEIVVDITVEEHLGISDNYRLCFSKCTGDYVAILEGDDYWTSRNKLNLQMKFLESNLSCDLVFSNFLLLRNGMLEQHPLQGKLTKEKLVTKDFFRYDLNPIINFSCCMFRTSFLKDLQEEVFKYRLSEITLGLLCAEKSYVGHISNICGVYRIHEQGVWSGLDKNEKRYSAYSVRFVAAQCVSSKNKGKILSELYSKYIKDEYFLQFLRDKENIEDLGAYLKRYYTPSVRGKSFWTRCVNKVPHFNRKKRRTISEYDAFIAELVNIAEPLDLRASIILTYIMLSKGETMEQLNESYKEIFKQKHGAKDFIKIARAYRDGEGVQKNLTESINWMNLAVDAGDLWSRIELISLLMKSEKELDNHRAFELAFKIYSDETDIHRKEAAIRLARMYNSGIGVEKSYSSAVSIYRNLVKINRNIWSEYIDLAYAHPEVLTGADFDNCVNLDSEDLPRIQKSKVSLILSRMYHNGVVVDKNLDTALQYVEKSIEYGNEWAIVEKISLLMDGSEENCKEAIKVATAYLSEQKSKHKGQVSVRVARIYRNGLIGEKNLDKAAEYYQRAIEFGLKLSETEKKSLPNSDEVH